MNEAEKLKVIDFKSFFSKSQFMMKGLKKLSYGRLVKLLYLAACVGIFFEEALQCLVHYVSK